MGFPRLDILPLAQRRLWDDLSEVPHQFTLYGGTALALHLGHRESVDFNFFSREPLVPMQLQQRLNLAKNAEVLQAEPNTLTLQVLRGGPVKVSFFGALDLGQIEPPLNAEPPGLRIAALADIAATKFKVITQRAEAKDYIDIHALLQHGILPEQMTAWAAVVFGAAFNPYPSVKAMTYFDDGDLAALPESTKQALRAAARRFGL